MVRGKITCWLALSLSLEAQSPQILQIYRDRLKPGITNQYIRIEEDVARVCVRLKCPHSYVALQSESEVWFLNAYASEAERRKVADDYAKNPELLAEMARVVAPKKNLVRTPSEVFASYQADLSSEGALDLTRCVLVTFTRDYEDARMIIQAMRDRHFVYGTGDGTLLVFTPAGSRKEADEMRKRNATMAADTYLLAAAPGMSFVK